MSLLLIVWSTIFYFMGLRPALSGEPVYFGADMPLLTHSIQ